MQQHALAGPRPSGLLRRVCGLLPNHQILLQSVGPRVFIPEAGVPHLRCELQYVN